MDVDLCLRPATELAQLVRSRQLSVRELLSIHITQIERLNPSVNAICTLNIEEAVTNADDLDNQLSAGCEPGPLFGLPIAIKDLVDVAGLPTTKGSPLYQNVVAKHDALIVQRLRNAGAIILGKTNVPEFGAGSHTFNTVFGVTRNPYDLSKSAGGSSGGSAAALSCGMIAIADGSDYGGSIRNPPNFNSVVGLRPTPGRVPNVPTTDPWGSLNLLGPMGRTVADTSLLLSVIAGLDPRDPIALCESPAQFNTVADVDLSSCKVAYSPDLGMLPVENEVTEVIEKSLPLLTDLGCNIDIGHPNLTGGEEAFDTIRAMGFAREYRKTLRDYRDKLKDTVIWNIERGLALSSDQIIKANHLRTKQFINMQSFLENFDVLILPVSQVLPFPIENEWVDEINGVQMDTYIDWMRSCSHITMTSHPALSLPCGFTSTGLPVGVQIVGKYRKEAFLLSFAAAWEEVINVTTKRPPMAQLPLRT